MQVLLIVGRAFYLFFNNSLCKFGIEMIDNKCKLAFTIRTGVISDTHFNILDTISSSKNILNFP
jgi:hypothetical protein